MTVEDLKNLWAWLISMQIPGVIVGSVIVLLLLFLNPEKIEKWSVMLWKVVYFLFKTGGKQIITHDIQGHVNDFVKSLVSKVSNIELKRIHIQWVSADEKLTEFISGKTLIVRMKHHEDQNRNFVYASMIFVSKVLLSKAKKYISSPQRESLDMFVGRKLFEREKPRIADCFFEEFYSKAISNEKIMDLCSKYELIEKVGLFFPALVQELAFFGEKVFYRAKSSEMIVEVRNLIDFLSKYADRKVGDTGTATTFEGSYCRCGIAIIARSVMRETGEISPYVNYIGKLLKRKLENIYLIGAAQKENKLFMRQIAEDCQAKYKLDRYLDRSYSARIRDADGKRIDVENYLILLRSPDAIRVYDEEYQTTYIDRPTPDSNLQNS